MTSTKAHDPVAAAKALAPQIRAARDEMQSRCRLPRPLAEVMARAGLFQLYAPSAIGGPETDPLTAFRAVEELSKVDGSVGWCSFVASAVSIYAGWMPAELGRELFGQPLDIRVAGSFRPTGQAQAVDGGYKIGGRWNYMSGVDHANWLFLNCNIMDGDCSVPMPVLDAEGIPVTRMMIVPADDGVIEETWSTLGMRGTGSNDLVIEETFVPEERSYLLYGPSPLEGPHYDPRTVTVTSWALVAANALGMARGAMDAFVRLATESGSTASPTLLRDRAPVQTTTGEAEAIISGARAYVLDAVGAVWEAACQCLRPRTAGFASEAGNHPRHAGVGAGREPAVLCGGHQRRPRTQRSGTLLPGRPHRRAAHSRPALQLRVRRSGASGANAGRARMVARRKGRFPFTITLSEAKGLVVRRRLGLEAEPYYYVEQRDSSADASE